MEPVPQEIVSFFPAGTLSQPGQDATRVEGTDSWCLAFWLHSRASKSEHTRRSYSREAHRWLAFLTASRIVQDQPLSATLLREATYADADRFLQWIDDKADLRARLPAQWPQAWRDATKLWGVSSAPPKSTDAVKRNAVVVLHGLYDEVESAMVGSPPQPAVQLNPFKPYRRQFDSTIDRSKDQPDAAGVSKALSDEAWALLWETACAPPADPSNKRQVKLSARRRLELAMLRATWERRAAAAGLTWEDLQRSRAGIWKVRRNRKNQGYIWESVPDALMQELARFRLVCGLPVTPGPDENGQSIYWIGGRIGREGPISDDTLYRDIKLVFEEAARVATSRAEAAEQAQNSDDLRKYQDLAAELTRVGAGPHSIRHTMATQFMAAGGEARRAQEILGHSSIAVTTRVYDSRSEAETAEALSEQWERSATSRGSQGGEGS